MIDWGALLADGQPAATAPASDERDAGCVPASTLELAPYAAEEPGNASAIPGIEARERRGDNRRYCIECGNLTESGRCLAAMRRQIAASRNYEPIRDILRRCEGFNPLPTDPDQRQGWDRWPGI